jgi:hypothetical protein
VGIGLRDPRSQKRDLGHPSVSPFDFYLKARKKPQVSPLRYAPAQMTNLLVQEELSSRPERTRISCHAALETTACAAFSKESRMDFASATNTNRKSGVAEWRDLRFLSRDLLRGWGRRAGGMSRSGFCCYVGCRQLAGVSREVLVGMVGDGYFHEVHP